VISPVKLNRCNTKDYHKLLLGRTTCRVPRFGLLSPPMFRGLCICLLDITVSCAKTDEPIEMPFGGVDSGEPKKPCIMWVSGSPRGMGNFGGHSQALYGLYLPTVILTVIWYFITHSLFLSRLKTFLLYKSFPL